MSIDATMSKLLFEREGLDTDVSRVFIRFSLIFGLIIVTVMSWGVLSVSRDAREAQAQIPQYQYDCKNGGTGSNGACLYSP